MMAMAKSSINKPKLRVYVDVLSPFVYLAVSVTKNSLVFRNCDVEYVPVLLGAITKAVGNKPPMEIKNKDKWLKIERLRWARSFHIPMSEPYPEGFPQQTLKIQRVLCALHLLHATKMPDVLEALLSAFWVDGRPTHELNTLREVLVHVLGETTTDDILLKSGSKEAKDLLFANTKAALADGAFGLPWFVATNSKGDSQSFWGFDHLAQVMCHLGLEVTDSIRAMEHGWRSLL